MSTDFSGSILMQETARVWLGAYLRLSVDDDDRDVSNSINNQRQIIDDYVLRHPELKIYKYYIDDGKTGMNYRRSGFVEMKEDIDAGRIQGVIVKDLSRFGREHCDTIYLIKKEFRLKRIRFISIVDNFDLYGSNYLQNNDMNLPFKIIVNDVYCQNISNNIRIVQERKQKAGLFIGSHARYGYRKDPDNKYHLLIDEEPAEVVRQMFQMALQGYNPGEIRRWLNENDIPSPTVYKKMQGSTYQCPKKLESTTYWTDASVRQILKCEMYIGNMVQHTKQKISYDIDKTVNIPKTEQRIVEGTHEAVIDKDTFDKVQTILKQRRRVPDFRNVSMYRGILFCGDCKRFLQKTTRTKGVVFRCPTYAHEGPKYCSAHYISESQLNSIVLKEIRKNVSKSLQAMDIKSYAQRTKQNHNASIQERIEALNKKKEELQNEKKQMLVNLSKKIIADDDYRLYNFSYQDTMADIEAKIQKMYQALEESSGEQETYQAWIQAFVRYKEISNLTREILLHLVERIEVYEDSITIKFYFHNPFK